MTPVRAALFLVLLFGILPAAPVLSDLSAVVGVPLQAPLLLGWLFLLSHSAGVRAPRGLGVACGLIGLGAIGLLLYDNVSDTRTWLGALVVPLLIFVGIQVMGERDLQAARVALRYVLLLACLAQLIYFAATAGPSALDPMHAYMVHTDVGFWREAGGRVLGNPNNASVVYCTAFAWAAAEFAAGKRLQFSWIFLLTSAAAVWCTGSRGAVLVALSCLFVLVMVRRGGGIRLISTLSVGGGVLLAVNWWLTRYDRSGVAGVSGSIDSRLETRRAAIPQVMELPWGHGPGSTASALRVESFRIFGTDSDGSTSHDVFLNWGISLGWLGLLLLLGVLVVAVRRAWAGEGKYDVLPLAAFFFAAQSAGIDVINSSNPAWAVLMWALIGFGWRGGLLPARLSLADPAPSAERGRLTFPAE